MSTLTDGNGFVVDAQAPAAPDSASASALSRLVTMADRLLFSAFLLAMLLSPFEAGYPPLTRFFNATFTNLELVLLLLAATLAVKLLVDPAARTRLLRMPLLLPIVALLVSCVLSYIFGEYKGEGINFTYRVAMGAMVLIAAQEAISSTRRLLWSVSMLALGAAISASTGLLEYAPFFNVEPLLAAFKPMPTTVGGSVRLSGTFEYANGAAFYFEMILPVVLGLAILFTSRDVVSRLGISERGRRVGQVFSYALWALFTLALLLTFSRAALAGALVSLVVFGLIGFVRRKNVKRVDGVIARGLAAAVVVMVAAALYIFVTQPVFRLRLFTENDRDWYGAVYSPGSVSALSAGEHITVPVTLRNTGPMIWRADGALVVHVSYHWLSADKSNYEIFEGARTPLPHDVEPGETVQVNADLWAPPREGTYYLEWDLAQEHYTWFSVKAGSGSDLAKVDVSPSTSGQATQSQAAKQPPLHVDDLLNSDNATISRVQLWRVASRMFRAHPVTGVGPDGFRNLYGEYAGVTSWNRNIYTNNTYVEMFTDLGLLGGLSFVWLGLAAIVRAGRNLLREKPSAAWFIGLGATAATVAFFFHGFLDYFLFSTPLYVIFWVLMSIAAMWPLMAARGQKAPGLEGD